MDQKIKAEKAKLSISVLIPFKIHTNLLLFSDV